MSSGADAQEGVFPQGARAVGACIHPLALPAGAYKGGVVQVGPKVAHVGAQGSSDQGCSQGGARLGTQQCSRRPAQARLGQAGPPASVGRLSLGPGGNRVRMNTWVVFRQPRQARQVGVELPEVVGFRQVVVAYRQVAGAAFHQLPEVAALHRVAVVFLDQAAAQLQN